MFKLTQLRFGISAALLLMLGFVWAPSAVNAASVDPQPDPSGPTASQYGYNGERNSEYNGERNGEYNNERNGEYNNERNSGYNDERNGEYNDTGSRSGVCASIHRVGLVENLSWIAAEYGVSVDDLASENNLDDTNLIYENQALCIPIYSSEPSSESRADDKYTSPSRSSGYGNQDNGYGYQDNGYGQPGKSYDPSSRYGDQGNGYGNQGNGYGQPGKSYDPSSRYGDQGNGYGDQGNGYGNQGNGYGDQGNGYDLQPGESRWSSE